MRRRSIYALVLGAVTWALPAVAVAQEVDPEDLEANLNWVFAMSLLVLASFLALLGFAFLYYIVGVLARNRRYASATAPAAPAAVAVAPAAPVAPSTQPRPAQPQAVAAPAPSTAEATPAPAPAPGQTAPAAAATAAPQAAPAVPAGGVPKIDINMLPDGIDAVARGRLKKLAVLQERGQAPPSALIEELKPVLEQIGGQPIDVSAATAAPAPAAASQPEPASSPEPAPAPEPQAEAAPAAVESPAAQTPASSEVPEPQTVTAPPEEAAPVPDTGGLPRIDPNQLPAGIDTVTRGRLKKLAVLQERGKPPPPDLVESLRPILDQMKGS